MAGPSLSPVDQLGPTFKDYAVSHCLDGELDHQITINNLWDPSTTANAVAYNWSSLFFSLSFKVQLQHHPLLGMPFLTINF